MEMDRSYKEKKKLKTHSSSGGCSTGNGLFRLYNGKKIFFFFIFILIAFFVFSVPLYARTGPVKVMASIFPAGDMAREVGGKYADVHTIMPPGSSPHVFEPTPSVMEEFSRADLFIRIGAGLELWADKLMSAAPKKMKVVTLSEGEDLIGRTSSGIANPHIWLDPVIAMHMTRKIETALSQADPANAKEYRKNADAFIKKLETLDSEIRNEISKFKIKSFVSFHPAWDYFARRYGLVSAGTIEEIPGREPTPQQLERLINNVKKKGIKAIFAEAQFNPRTAQIIARDAGAKVVILDPEGSVAGTKSYIDLMKFNLARMKEVME